MQRLGSGSRYSGLLRLQLEDRWRAADVPLSGILADRQRAAGEPLSGMPLADQ
jgi:hypothetical protein